MRPDLLIVEDDPVQQKLYRLLCAKFGYDCTVFPTVEEASQHLRNVDRLPHIVLLDCLLNGADSLYCVPTLKVIAAERNATLPVVAVTANAFDTDRQRCFHCGVDDYLAKPFTLDQYTGLVQRWSADSCQTVA